MLKEKALRVALMIVPASFLLACSLSGLAAPAGDSEKTPTGAAIGAGGDSDGAAVGGSAAGGGDVGSVVESNSYGIYVRAVVTGKCGAYTNSGGFKDAEFEASFEGIVFVRPMGKGLPGPFGGLRQKDSPAGITVTGGTFIDGSGTVDRVEYCPQYETEVDTYPVKIISDINPFQAWIGVMSPTAEDAPEGVNPTKTPVGGGEAWIMFHIGNALNGGPIWEFEVDGSQGQEDELSIGDPVRFITTWDQLMKGEDFTITMESGDEGEIWKWEMRLVPEPIK
jgi:hypothetical protein